MTNLAEYINELRSEPEVNPGDANRNRMLASFLEGLQNEGPMATLHHFHDVIACMLITYKAMGADITMASKSINFIISNFVEALTE